MRVSDSRCNAIPVQVGDKWVIIVALQVVVVKKELTLQPTSCDTVQGLSTCQMHYKWMFMAGEREIRSQRRAVGHNLCI